MVRNRPGKKASDSGPCHTARAGEGEGARKALAAVESLVANEDLVEGLAPIYVSPHNGKFAGSQITLGARGDSFYEYLLKQWLLTGKQNDNLLRHVIHGQGTLSRHCDTARQSATTVQQCNRA